MSSVARGCWGFCGCVGAGLVALSPSMSGAGWVDTSCANRAPIRPTYLRYGCDDDDEAAAAIAVDNASGGCECNWLGHHSMMDAAMDAHETNNKCGGACICVEAGAVGKRVMTYHVI